MHSDQRDLVDGTSIARRLRQAATERALNFQWGRMLLLAPFPFMLCGVSWLAWENIAKKDLMNNSPVVPVDKVFNLATQHLRHTTQSTNGTKTPMFIRVAGWVKAESAITVPETNKANKVVFYTETTYRLASSLEALSPPDVDGGTTNMALTNMSPSVVTTNFAFHKDTNALSTTNISTFASLTLPPATLYPRLAGPAPTIKFSRRRVATDYERPFETMPKLGDPAQTMVLTLPNRTEEFTYGETNTLFVTPLKITSAEEARVDLPR
jgi:hypothetical protein